MQPTIRVGHRCWPPRRYCGDRRPIRRPRACQVGRVAHRYGHHGKRPVEEGMHAARRSPCTAWKPALLIPDSTIAAPDRRRGFDTHDHAVLDTADQRFFRALAGFEKGGRAACRSFGMRSCSATSGVAGSRSR